MGFILKTGFNATTIQLTGDSDALVKGNEYRFAPNEGKGFLSFPSSGAKESSECIHDLEDFSFTVTRDRGNGKYSISFKNKALQLPASCTDLDWSNAEILPLLPMIGSLSPECFNTEAINTTETGWTGSCVKDLYKPMCSDVLALNYHPNATTSGFTHCRYDQSSGMSVKEIQDKVKFDENNDPIEGYDYISLEYSPTGVLGEYDFWALISPEILPLVQYVAWYWDDGSAADFGQNGVIHTFAPGSTNVIQLNVNTGYSIIVDYVTIVVPDSIPGCTNPEASNYNPNANTDDGSCKDVKFGCTDSNASNYNNTATNDDDSCVYEGCTDMSANNTGDTVAYGANPIYVASIQDNTICTYDVDVRGCMDATAWNYNSLATTDDGSCIEFIPGCLNPEADNYNSTPGANQHVEAMCEYYDCTDAAATNTAPATSDVAEYFENTAILSYTYPTGNTIPVAPTHDASLCKYNITVETVCIDTYNDTGAIGAIEEDIIYQAYPANDGSGELAIFSGKSCLLDLVATDNHTWSGVTGQRFTQERVRVQVLDCENTVLNLQNPEENAEIVYDFRDLVGSPAITAEHELAEDNLQALVEAAQVAGYTGSVTSKAYYFFRIRSAAEDLEAGFASSSDGSVEALFSNATNIASITRINDTTFGETTYDVSGSVPAGFAGSNGELLFGYKEGSDEDGNIADNTAWSGAPCNPGGDPEPFYIVYRVEVSDPCVPTSIDFSEVLTCSVSGCTDETATNYNVNANIEDGSCTYSGCTDDTYLEYNANVTISDPSECITPIVYGCTDVGALNYDENANINEVGDFSLVPYDAVEWADGLVSSNTDVGISDSSAYNNMVYFYKSGTTSDLSITRKLLSGRTYTLGMRGKWVSGGAFTKAIITLKNPSGVSQSIGNFVLDTDFSTYEGNTESGSDTFTANETGDYTFKFEPYLPGDQLIIGEFTLVDQSPTDDICLYDIDLETESENCDELIGHHYNYNGVNSLANVASSPNSEFAININDGDILSAGELASDNALSTYTQIGSGTSILFEGTAYEHTFIYNSVSRVGFNKCQVLSSGNAVLYTGNPYEDGLHTYTLTIKPNADTSQVNVVENISPSGIELVQSHLSDLGYQGTLNRTVSYIFRMDTTSLQYISGQDTATLLQAAADSSFPYTFRRATTGIEVTPGNPFTFGPLNLSAAATSAYPEGYVYANGDDTVKTPAYYLYEAVPNNAECSVEQLNLSGVFEDFVDDTIYGCTNALAANYDPTAEVDNGECLFYPMGVNNTLPTISVEPTNSGCEWGVSFSVLGVDSENAAHTTWSYEVNAGVNIEVYQFLAEGGLGLVASGVTYVPCEIGISDSPEGVFITDSWEGFTTIDVLEGESGELGGTNNFQVQVTFSYEGVEGVDDLVLTSDFTLEDIIYGCTTPGEFNYNENATCSDQSCINTVFGCTSSDAFNFNSAANTDDGSCVDIVEGCTSPTITFNGSDVSTANYNADANVDDDSCYICPGIADSSVFNISSVPIEDAVSVYSSVFAWDPNINGTNLVDLDLSDSVDVSPVYVSVLTNNSIYSEPLSTTYLDLISGIQFPQFIETAGVVYKLTGLTFTAVYNGQCEETITAGLTLTPSSGCIDSTQFNYSPTATYQGELCEAVVEGCMNSDADNYNSSANTEDTCEYSGCTSDWAENFDPTATVDDGSCYLHGCTDPAGNNYNGNATILSICTYLGCSDSTADNYIAHPGLIVEDGSCEYTGCMDTSASNYSDIATTGAPCTYVGCTSIGALNTDIPSAYQAVNGEGEYYNNTELSDGSTIIGCADCCKFGGCTDSNYDNYNPIATDDDGTCETLGCTSDWADNYNDLANVDDGSCLKYGCTDESASNTTENATIDNGTCLYDGCTLEFADNTDEDANNDDDSCFVDACIVPGNYNYDAVTDANVAAAIEEGYAVATDSSQCYPVISGCMDTTAINYIQPIGDTYTDVNTGDNSCCSNYTTSHLGDTILNGSALADEDSWGTGINHVGNTGAEVVSFTSTDEAVYTVATKVLEFESEPIIGSPYTLALFISKASAGTTTVTLTNAAGDSTSSGELTLTGTAHAASVYISSVWDGEFTLSISGVEEANTIVITDFILFPTVVILPTLYNLDCSGGNPYTFISWDEMYSTTPPAGVTSLTVQSQTTAGAVVYTDSNVAWDALVPQESLITTATYTGWVAESPDYAVTSTDTSVTLTATAAPSGVAGHIALSGLDEGTGITFLSTGSTSAVYNLEFTLTSDDANAVVEIFDTTTSTVLTYNATNDLLFSVPSGSADTIQIRVANIDGSNYATLTNLSLTRVFPVGLLNGSNLGQHIVVSFNYYTDNTTSPACPYSHTLVVSNTCGSPIPGCTDNGPNPNGLGLINDANGDGHPAFNYNPLANFDDGSCTAKGFGCTDVAAFNYNSAANTDDGTCYPVINGCMDDTMFNFIPLVNDTSVDVNTDDGSCYAIIPGCTDSNAVNYNDTDGDGDSDPLIGDGTDINTDDGTCCYDYIDDATGESEYEEIYLPKFYWGEEELIENSIPVTDDSVYAHARIHVYKANVPFPAAASKGNITGIVVKAKNAANVIDTVSLTEAQFNPILVDGKVKPNSGGALLHAYKYNLDGSNYVTTTPDRPSTDIVNDPNIATSVEVVVTYTTDGENPCTFTIIQDTTTDVSDVSTHGDYAAPKSLYGCTDPGYLEYWLNPATTPISANAFVDDGSCAVPVIEGCMDTDYEGYYASECVGLDSFAPSGYTMSSECIFTDISAGQQTYSSEGTMQLPNFNNPELCNSALNYHPNSCTDPSYVEFYNGPDADGVYGTATGTSTLFAQGQVQDVTGCSTAVIEGCVNALDANGNYLVDYEVTANVHGSSTCSDEYYGCTNPLYMEYDANASEDDGSCLEIITEGCMNPLYLEYDANINVSNAASCINLIVVGCQDIAYCNYNPNANAEPAAGSFEECTGLAGCSDNTYFENYIGATQATNSVGDVIYTVNSATGQYSCELTGLEGTLCNTQLVYGCTDPSKVEYNPSANIDDGTCGDDKVEGCMNPNAYNYDPLANVEDGSCEDIIEGCTDDTMFNYNPEANTNDGSCVVDVSGCTNEEMFNYNENATTDDNSCYAIITGCMDTLALNFNNPTEGEQVYVPFASNILTDVNTSDPSMCIASVNGCMDETAENYNELATTDNGTCTYIVGCMDDAAYNYSEDATQNDGTCLYCSNYDNTTTTVVPATTSLTTDGSITVNIPEGLNTPSIVWEVDEAVIVEAADSLVQTGLSGGAYTLTISDSASDRCDTTILEVEVGVVGIGCTDESADNYCEGCATDDGSCFYTIHGCTDETATNYSEEATVNDGTCVYIEGCMDDTACNYNADATISAICTYAAPYRDCEGECNYPSAVYDGLCDEEVTTDCMDPDAVNYVGGVRGIIRSTGPASAPTSAPVMVPTSIADDGSCIYNNECQPRDIAQILDALTMTVADHGKTMHTHLKTGMLSNEATFNFWRLTLIDHLLRRKGSDAVFNCQDFDQKGYVTYEGKNYLDKFLTFAFRMGEKNFEAVKTVRSTTETYQSGSKTTKK